MKISDEGIRLIKSFEGYHTRLKDGSCAAYLCPAGVATIGWGCTEGIKLGMVWTAKEAEAALRREIAKFEDAVNRAVTVEINQNEFDALVSLAYNIGAAGFARSSVVKRLNKGNRDGAAKAFHMWNQGGGRVLKGLVSRRAREAALFMKPVEAPEEPFMPQAVSASSAPIPMPVAVAASVGGTASGLGLQFIPAPEIITQALPPYQALAETLMAFGKSPGVWVGLAVLAFYFVAAPWLARRLAA